MQTETSEQLVYERLSGRQKAALLVASIEVGVSSPVIALLTQSQAEEINDIVPGVRGAAPEVIDSVMHEFRELMSARELLAQGAVADAHRALEQTLGFSRASDLIDRMRRLAASSGFSVLNDVDPHQLAFFLRREHPQTVAFILSKVDPGKSAQVLMQFEEEYRNSISLRLATLGPVSPDVAAAIERFLQSVVHSEIFLSATHLAGPEIVANVLNKFPAATSAQVVEHIRSNAPAVADEIARLMFRFDDIAGVNDRGIQRILMEVDKKDLALALKGTGERLKEKIHRNLSERAREVLKEELTYIGLVRPREIEAAQARIIEVVKQLEETGEVVVPGREGAHGFGR